MGQCRDKYKNWVENLIKLASLQTSFVTMDEALKVQCSSRRLEGRVSVRQRLACEERCVWGARRDWSVLGVVAAFWSAPAACWNVWRGSLIPFVDVNMTCRLRLALAALPH